MAESVNQAIADQLLERQLLAGRIETRYRRDVWAILGLLEAEILAALKANDPTQFALLARRRREVEQLMAEEIDPLIEARYAQLATLMDEAMMRLATNEAEAVQAIVNSETEDETIAVLPSERRVRAGVVHGLFPSPAKPTDLATTGREWWQRQGEGLAQRIGDSLLVGVALGESLTDLTRRVRGTSEAAFTDGIMGRARQDASRLVATQVTNAVTEARMATGERNADKGLIAIHQSVLDSRTCLDGETLIRTPSGPKPIQIIVAGDMVFGGSGELRRVLATHKTPTRQLARITFSDGTAVLCTPDHRFLTKDFGWVEAQKLQENTVLREETMLY